MTVQPAKCFNLPPAQLRVGGIADLTLIDPEKKVVFTEKMIRSKSVNTPFLGQELKGLAVFTFVGGKKKFSFQEEFGSGS